MSVAMERYEQPLALIQSIDDLARLSKQVAESNYYGDTRNAQQAAVKLMIARELGLGLTSISTIHLVEGKITLGYQLMIALVKRSDKYQMKFRERTDDCVRIEWFERDDEGQWESVGFSKFDMKDAERAGIKRGNYGKYPVRMLTARAVSDGFNAYAPECAGGALYTESELDDGPSRTPQPDRPIASARPQMVSAESLAVNETIVDAETVEADPVDSKATAESPTPLEPEPSASTVNPTARVKAMLASLTTAELDAVKEACLTLKLKATPRGMFDAFDEHAFERDTFLVAISNAVNAHAQGEVERQQGIAEARTAEVTPEIEAGAAEFEEFKAEAANRWGGGKNDDGLVAAGGFGS